MLRLAGFRRFLPAPAPGAGRWLADPRRSGRQPALHPGEGGERWMIAIGQNTKIQTEAIMTQQKEISASDAK